MADVAFHLSEEFIAEDLDYYFSGERDKNNQIRPDDNILSMTPNSSHLGIDYENPQVTNFFYPSLPNLLDRIYIGISIPLFANNWGASFLLQLLKVLKPGGAVILPVYPEGQAQEKGYWSRSFLENIFLSRQRWTGFSNVTAENDGVMSLRVGRKWPDPIPSCIEWFYQQRANISLQTLLDTGAQEELRAIYSSYAQKVWDNYFASAVIERIIQDKLGAKTEIQALSVSADHGMLLTELLLSPYINVTYGVSIDISNEQSSIAKNFESYFSAYLEGKHQTIFETSGRIESSKQMDVVCLQNCVSITDSNISNSRFEKLFDWAWSQVKPNGLLVILDDLEKTTSIDMQVYDQFLSKYGQADFYSSIVASKIQPDIEISHYSTIQERNLVEEKQNKTNVFRVIRK